MVRGRHAGLINVTCPLVGLYCCSAGPEFIRRFLQTNLRKGVLGPGREEGLSFILSVSLSLYLFLSLCARLSVSLSLSLSLNLSPVPSVAVRFRAWGLVTFSSLALGAV